ncbi:hypothetical protein BC941DRAFT_440394 [Chlamydoabsidia padenii]|nr:hypothetical protein BC941DRAFT_440394 [Chlamydoabsidia padenii]
MTHHNFEQAEKENELVEDIDTLRMLLIDKERERQSLANDLDVAARLGLVISETNEALHVKLARAQQENQALQQAMTRNTPRERLTQELNQARADLDKLRLEMDGMANQLVDMTTEIVKSRSRIGTYAKRLADVEHKLTITRDMNHQLQTLLERTLLSQQQSTSTTSLLVKNLQNDLIKVIAENDQLKHRIMELEHQQMEGEDRLSTMASQAHDYATLLEQAQNTIHQLNQPRLESDEDDLSTLSSSTTTGYNDMAKGTVFSVEFRQEMQKEIERNLLLRNDLKHRIITVDQSVEKKGKGLEALLANSSRRRYSNHQQNTTMLRSPISALRPATFLTGFKDEPSWSQFKRPTRHHDPNEPSISTRFFHRLASRFDES